MADKNFYDVLGVSRDASVETIKRAYRKKASAVHPDKPHGGDADKLAEYNHAWEVLGDSQRRLTYDKTGYDESQGEGIDEAGQSILMDQFDAVMSTGNVDGIIEKVALACSRTLMEHIQQGQQLRRSHKALSKVRTKVRRKSKKGNNVYEMLIDKRLHMLEEGMVTSDRRIEEFKEALKLLEDYELEPETLLTFVNKLATGQSVPVGKSSNEFKDFGAIGGISGV